MIKEEAKSCIGTIETLRRLAYNIHGVMDAVDAENCEKIIKALEQEPVLDKIRAEIKQLPYQRIFGMVSNYSLLDVVVEIIDKYRESEDNK